MMQMRYEIGPNSCRICLQQDKKVRSIYKAHDEGDETPNDMLVQLLGVSFSKLNNKEPVPELICKECEVTLNMAFQFRERALKVQNIIEEFLREEGLLEIEDPVVIENMFIKEEDMRDQINDNAPIIIDEEHDVVEEIDGQEVFVEDQDHDYQVRSAQSLEFDIEIDSNGNDEANTDDADIEYLEDNYIEVDPTQEEYDDNDSTEDMLLPHDVQPVERKIPRRTISNTSRVRRNLPNSLSKIKKEKENGFICDICGNIYEKRGRMLEHRRRHDAVYHYQCELCEERFQAREQLRKHMYSHTGSKPYKCSFCSRTFFYESVLKTHENVHRGVKPYICKLCNKAFAYSHSLSKHELIHSDIKLFHCEYCNKDFRLPHHMRQHEETKLHQNAVQMAQQQMKIEQNVDDN